MREGRFYNTFLFVPQYNGRSRPEGAFAGWRPMVFDKWRTRWSQDYSRDVAFVVTRPRIQLVNHYLKLLVI